MNLRLITLAALILALLPAPAFATGKNAQIKSLQDEIAALKTQIELLQTQDASKAVEGLKKQFAALERRVAQLERKSRQQGKPQVAKPQVDSATEGAAKAAFAKIRSQVAQLQTDQAKAGLKDFFTKYTQTKTVRQARSLESELSVVGLDAPAQYEIAKWFQGQDEVQLGSGKATVLVFWEIWCPHCRREVPKVQALYNRFKDKGLQIVGLTKLNRNKTEAELEAFIKDKAITYPIAKETGTLSRAFKVRGVPAAAIVKDGKIVWRGHPAYLNDALLKQLL